MDNQKDPAVISKTPSKRILYINDETPRRDMNTPFHSPYKNGKRNPQYSNPSFISSHLFYPNQYQQQTTERQVLKSNQVLTPNQAKLDQLCRKRMKTETSGVEKREKDRKESSKSPLGRILRVNEREYLMKNELNILQNYRENTELKQGKIGEMSRKRYQEPEIPVFLEKRRQQAKSSVSPIKAKKEEYRNMVRELNQLNRSGRGEEEAYRANLQKLIEDNHRTILEEDEQMRRQRYLLGSILKEQIKTKQVLQERRWNY